MCSSAPGARSESLDHGADCGIVALWKAVRTCAAVGVCWVTVVLAGSEAKISKELRHDAGFANASTKLLLKVSRCNSTNSGEIAVVI